MKKVIAFLLCLFIIIALLTGCGETQPQSQPGTPSQSNSQPEDNSMQAVITLPEVQSPAPYLTKPCDDNGILLNASMLTEILTLCLDNKATPEEPAFNFYEFLVRCAIEEQEDFKYYGAFPYEKPTGYIFPINMCETAVFQVFGFDAWDVRGALANEMRDENTAVIPTEVGWGMTTYRAGDFITSSFINDKTQVCCNFEMHAPAVVNGDPGSVSLGMYNIIFDIVKTADGEIYLQFNHYEKA